MTIVTRRKVAGLVPWVALVAVTIFAFAQMRARVADEREDPGSTGARAAVDAVDTPARSVVSEAALAAETALDTALVDLEEARAEAATRTQERDAALDRAEAAEAGHGVSAARVEALEAAVTEATAKVQAFEEEIEHLRAAAAVHEDPVLEWLEDASSGDATRQTRARERASSSTEKQVAHLHALVVDDATRVPGAVRLVTVLPTGDETDRLTIALLLDPAADPARVSRIGPAPLQRVAVAEAVLRDADPSLALEALGWLAAREPAFSEEERERLAAASRKRMEGFDEDGLVLGARATGLLRLPGLAAPLLVLVKHEAAAVRAAATHAISRLPRLADVREEAVRCLAPLLLDHEQVVRTAAALLAEALLGGAVDYDPTAGEAVRREAAQRVLDQLD